MLFVSSGNVERQLSRLYDRLYQHIRCGCQTLLEEFPWRQIRYVNCNAIFGLERFTAFKQYSEVGEKLDNVEVMDVTSRLRTFRHGIDGKVYTNR
jgi:hypothetical protein